MNRNSKILIPFMLPVSLKREGMADKTQAVSEDKEMLCQSAMMEEAAGLAVRDNTITNKRHYQTMAVTPIATSVAQCILAGSNALVNIEANEISVTDFEGDTVFPTDGYEVNYNF